MLKKHYISAIFFLMGLACFVIYQALGSNVDDEGLLQEPFFLIIFGVVFTFIAILIFTIELIVSYSKKNRLKN